MAERDFIAEIARQDWLEPLEKRGQDLLHELFKSEGAGKVKDGLHGTWIGHPLHVILTDIPIGAWTAALVFDAIDSIGKRKGFSLAADSAVALGLVGALGAAVSGATDWQDIDPPARRIGLVHALINIASVGLFAGSLIARRNGKRASGRTLAVLGYVVSATAARLGGSLVYGEKIGVDHSRQADLPEQFSAVISETELTNGKATRADYKGTPIVLIKRGSHLYALDATCSHLGGPLAEGKLDGDTIQCPWHGSKFSIIDGHVVKGPSVYAQPCLDVEIQSGQVRVRRRG